jgi:hypothetical protein
MDAHDMASFSAASAAPKVYPDKISLEGNSHQGAVDPSSYTHPEYRVAKLRQQKEKSTIFRDRAGQSYPRFGFGHVDQLTVNTPRPVYCHNSDVKRVLKSHSLRCSTTFGGGHLQTTINRPGIRPPPLSLGPGRAAGGRMNRPRSKVVAWAASTGRLKK